MIPFKAFKFQTLYETELLLFITFLEPYIGFEVADKENPAQKRSSTRGVGPTGVEAKPSKIWI
jgi:hypothetical protein